MKRFVALSLGCWIALALVSEKVTAFPQFNKGFKELYAGDDAPEGFKKAVAKAKCNVCHDPNKKTEEGKSSKKFRNPYGEALGKLLGKEDKKNKEKIQSALREVEEEKAPDSDETYGERIESEKLPYGP